MWITNGGDADVLVVYAKTDPDAGARGVTAFLVDKAFKGFSCGPHLDKLGMRGSNTFPLFFDQCEVPEDNVLGGVGQGAKVLMSGLDYERAVLCGGPLGIMAACMDLTVPYLHERRQFGRPIGDFQLMQAKLADMYVTWQAASALVYAVGRACDRGEHARSLRKDAAAAILHSAEKATWMAGETIQALMARRQALRNRRGHIGNPTDADRPRTDGRNRLRGEANAGAEDLDRCPVRRVSRQSGRHAGAGRRVETGGRPGARGRRRRGARAAQGARKNAGARAH
jgi:alkylation response protein AidB-like acyl-CoA dehydrogenase